MRACRRTGIGWLVIQKWLTSLFLFLFPPLFNKAAFLTEETTWWNISELLWDPDHGHRSGPAESGAGGICPYFGRFVNPIPIRGTDYGHIINTCPPQKKFFSDLLPALQVKQIYFREGHIFCGNSFFDICCCSSAGTKKSWGKKIRGKKFWELLQIVRSLHSRLWAHNKEVPTFLAKLGVWKSKCYTKTKTCFIYILDT